MDLREYTLLYEHADREQRELTQRGQGGVYGRRSTGPL